MKKSILLTFAFLQSSLLVFAQKIDQDPSKIDQEPFELDITNILIGLVVGVIIGYFLAKNMGDKK